MQRQPAKIGRKRLPANGGRREEIWENFQYLYAILCFCASALVQLLLMRKVLISILFLFSFIFTFAQQRVQHARQAGWRKLVYQVPADTAEKYIKDHTIQPHHYLSLQPFTSWHADTANYEGLPAGNYIVFSVIKNKLVAEYYCQSRIKLVPVNDQHRVQLEVRDSSGAPVPAARLWVNGKEIARNSTTSSFIIKNKKPDEALIKVAIPGDTLFMELTAMEDMDRTTWQQWWSNFGYTKTGRVLGWPVQKVKRLFRPGRYYRSRSKKDTNYGYMVFNKPKYQPGDTVRLKAYVLDKRKKVYRKPLILHLSYTCRGAYTDKKLTSLSPQTPGAFLYEFVLGDSLESDRQYAITWKDGKRARLRGTFKIEDYLLDEVTEYNLRAEKGRYTQADTLVFYASAKDANGLGLMDGRVQLALLTERIDRFYDTQMWVPDTLWTEELSLAAEGDTKIVVPAARLPQADMQVSAKAVFRNSNNEIQEKQVSIEYRKDTRQISIDMEDGWLQASYTDNGIVKKQPGWLVKDNDRPEKISFPFRQKADPLTERYIFTAMQDTVQLAVGEYVMDNYSSLHFQYLQQGDSSGFALQNPRKALVHFSIFDGRRLLYRGSDTAARITWYRQLPRRHMYRVEWNYIWAGREHKGNHNIARLDKLLQTDIKGEAAVYPGKKDTITVSVRDYKGRPASGVNLTAVSYNSQFQKDIRVNEPPYLQTFRLKRRILFDNYELEDADFSNRFLLGEHPDWRNIFPLDTMLYYQLLFPKDSFATAVQQIAEYEPQVSLYVVKKGVPQPVYLQYINRRLVWYHGINAHAVYAHSTQGGYTQFGFRLRDKFIEIDSIYLQPFYKYDIVFDLDRLPAGAKVTKLEAYYTPFEISQLENSLIQIPADYRYTYGVLWQGNRVMQLAGYKKHLAGPFSAGDSIHFYQPAAFDIKFAFEPGYAYRFSPKMVRLERSRIFPENTKAELPVFDPEWKLGDTVLPHPVVNYTVSKPVQPFLQADHTYYPDRAVAGKGRISIVLPPDSLYMYGILYSGRPDTVITRIREYGFDEFTSVDPGRYTLVFITKHYQYLEIKDVEVKANATLCLLTDHLLHSSLSDTIKKIRQGQEGRWRKTITSPEPVDERPARAVVRSGLPSLSAGNARITGRITDKAGKLPVQHVAVQLKGYATGTTSGEDGFFILENLPAGTYQLVFSALGYEAAEHPVSIAEGGQARLDISLNAATYALQEVVVTAYGTNRKKTLTASTISIRTEEVTGALMGKVAGVSVSGNDGATTHIRLRGATSLTGNAKPLYVIDGMPVDELPEGMVLDNMQVSVLKGAAAVSIYGARAADGVIIIYTPGFMAGGLRETFRDYAFWMPNLITDKNGQVKFEVTYPDNVTSWQTFIVGMDKKKRITKASSLVKSFKPMLAQLAAPAFLTEGDSAMVVGKVLNYTASPVAVRLSFRINDQPLFDNRLQTISGSGAVVDHLPVKAVAGDTLLLQYQMEDDNGYKDGELRRVPVIKKGTEEAKGQFWALLKDTSFTFYPDTGAGEVQVYAHLNTLDLLLDELKHLEEYPYFCMEQTASKLKGLLMEQRIRKALGLPFKKEKTIRQLLKKMQEGQLFDGGWAWWSGEANADVTVHVMETLLLLKDDPLVKTNIRNAVLFIQNNLLKAGKRKLPATLLALSGTGHTMDYGFYLQQLSFDSLTLHQQWQVIKIKQQQKLDYRSELDIVMKKQNKTMTGGVYWGEDSYYWADNSMATTALAYSVLENEVSGSNNIGPHIIRYFLEQRKDGKWRNTVESANTVAAILPAILREQASFISKPVISVNGTVLSDTIAWRIKAPEGMPVHVKKNGGGMVYLTAWQTFFNKHPLPVTDKFEVKTWFEKTGTIMDSLQAGESVTMKVKIKVIADAEYVMAEIPIPAGCTYAAKKQQGYKVHKEYLKNKVVLFAEKMPAGEYEYDILLETRYSGVYQLNPAKASLMYFPVFYGRNELKSVPVKN